MKLDFKDPNTQRISTIILVILVVLAGIVGSYFRGETDASSGYLNFTNDGYFTIYDANGNFTRFYYAEIDSVEYLPSVDFGTPTTGCTKNGWQLGQWESTELGTYLNCTMKELNSCVLVTLRDGSSCALSYESEKTTAELADAIERMIP